MPNACPLGGPCLAPGGAPDSRPQVTAIGDEAASGLAELYKCFADPSRLRLLSALIPAPLTVSELSEAAGMSVSSVSHALKQMKLLRVVKMEKQGRNVLCSLSDDHVKLVLEMGMAHLAHDE